MSGLRFDGETKLDNGDLTTDYRGAHSEYPSEFDVEVRIDRSIFRDTAKPLDGGDRPVRVETFTQLHVLKGPCCLGPDSVIVSESLFP
jgi:hypothetical protein